MRDILVNSGTPHQDPTREIGPRPNLPEAVEYLNTHYGLNLGTFATVHGDQQDAGGVSFGQLRHYKYNQFIPHEVPHDFLMLENSEQAILALQDFKPETTEKFNEWRDLPDIINHYGFTVSPNPQPLIAQFGVSADAAISLEVISADNIEIPFADPWLIDTYDPQYNHWRNQGINAPARPYQSPLNLTLASGFKGVLQDQNPEFDPDKPIYSVDLPQQLFLTFHGRQLTWNFLGWEYNDLEFQDDSQASTKIVFEAGGAWAKGTYKGHLVSNNSAATAHNNGRRVVKDGNGVLHAVYEDNKQIWYTYSTDGGEYWSAEELVEGSESDIGAEYLYPAIAEYNGKLHVAYTEIFYFEGEPAYYEMLYQSKNITGGQWPGAQQVEIVNDPDIIRIPKPAIEIWKGSVHKYVIIVFNRINAPSQIATYYKETGEPNFHSLDDIEGSNPSLGAEEGNQFLDLTYESGFEIYIRRWHNGLYWTAEKHLSEGLWWLSWNHYSNNTFYGISDKPSRVVWVAQDETLQPVVAYRTFRYPAQWGELTCFSSGGSPAHPTVAVDETWDKVIIFFEEDGAIIRRQKSGEYWMEKTYGSGWYPNVAGHVREFGAIWATESSAPYRIRSDYTIPESPPEGGDPLAEDTLVINKRLDFTFKQNTTVGHLTLHIEKLNAGSRWLQFNSQLHTRQITVPPNAAAQFNLRCRFHNLTFPIDTLAVLFKISFDDGQAVRPLGALRVKDLLVFNTGQYHSIPKTLPLGLLAGKRGRLQLSFGEILPVISDVVVRPDSGEVDISVGKTGGEDNLSRAALPAEFKLHQNYPNPFNPSTTIEFQLPARTAVSLKIYDIQGRLVKTLVKQEMEAGNHQVVWDGKDEAGNAAASGVYLYHFRAGNFGDTGKMVLMR
jgi:hypothetical protein